MKRLFWPLAALVLLSLALTPSATPAQEAAPAKPLILTESELKLWHAWMTADFKACYAQAQSMNEGASPINANTVALSLQSRCASELNWTKAFLADLETLEKDAFETKPRTFAREEALRQLVRLGRVTEAATQSRAMGFIEDWWLLGPFPNDRGQGFADTQEPENGFDLDGRYTGKEGQVVTWRKSPATPLAGVIDIGATMRPNREATCFLLTALWSDTEGGLATLGLASTDQVKVWHLGQRRTRSGEEAGPLGVPLLEIDRERELGFDQDLIAVDLRKGWNPILVKAGAAEGEWKLRLRRNSTLRVAATDAEIRGALANLDVKNIGLALGVGGVPESKPLSENEEFNRVAQELLRPTLDKSATGSRATMDSVLDLYRKLTDDFASADPREGAVLCYVAAWANASSAGVAAGREENRRRQLLVDCLKLEPKAARAALELSQYYTRTFANPTLADEYAAMAAKLRPDWVEARVNAAAVLSAKGLSGEIERELPKLLKEFPDHPAVLRQAAYYAGRRDDYAASNALFERALAADFTDTYSRDRLLERAVSRGDLAAATRYAGQRRQLDPFDTRASVQLADLHIAQGKYDAAEKELNAALMIAPRDDRLLARAGQVLAMWAFAESGDKQAELKARSLARYREALEANPKREDLIRYLEFQDRERPKFEALLQEDITERIKKALASPREGDSAYEVIYQDQITVINDDGTKSFYTQEARRVLNDDGRDSLQSMRAPAWGGQQSRCVEARLYRAAGGVEEGRRSGYGATFTDLAVGDIVHVRFRVTDREQGFFGDFFGDIQVLADYVPVKEMRLVYVLPQGRDFHEYTTLDAPKRAESTVEGRRVWSYTAKDIPKIPEEVLAPEPHQRAATVQVSTYKDWKDFGRWYYNLIRKQLEPTPEMTAKVAELTAGAKTEKEKVRAVYNWVVTEVRYNADWHFGVHGYKPFSAGAVFARCIGDCKDKAILICTMLRIAGVNAFPVIINLEYYRGEEDITLPMPHHFNHAIAYIEYADGTRQFLDGTATYNGMDELPAADSGANVIVVKPDGGIVTQVPIPAAQANARHDEVEGELTEQGAMKLKVTRTAVGDAASNLRATFQREGERQRLLEQEWSDKFAGAKVSDITTSDLASLDTPPWIKFTVDIPAAATVKDGEISFRLGLNPHELGKTAYGALGTRKTDMLLPPPNAMGSTWRIKLPKGMQPAALPEKFKAEGKQAGFEVSTGMEQGQLVIKRSYAIHGGVVKPGDYAAWRRAILDYDKAESATITLKKGDQQ